MLLPLMISAASLFNIEHYYYLENIFCDYIYRTRIFVRLKANRAAAILQVAGSNMTRTCVCGMFFKGVALSRPYVPDPVNSYQNPGTLQS